MKRFINKRGEEAAASKENKKPLIIALVSLGVILIISLGIFLGPRVFAGKAVFTVQTEQGTAGYSGDLANLKGEGFDFVIAAQLGHGPVKPSVAYSFQLKYPADRFTVSVTTPRDAEPDENSEEINDPAFWGSAYRRENSVADDRIHGVLTFEHATPNYRQAIIVGEDNAPVVLATVRFELIPGQAPLTDAEIASGIIDFVDITVLNLDSNVDEDIIKDIKQPSKEVPADCDAWFANNKDVKCKEWLNIFNKDDLFNQLTPAQKDALKCNDGFNPDLNNDRLIDDGDIIVLQLGLLAGESRYDSCGGPGDAACNLPPIYVCDNFMNQKNAFNCPGGE